MLKYLLKKLKCMCCCNSKCSLNDEDYDYYSGKVKNLNPPKYIETTI